MVETSPAARGWPPNFVIVVGANPLTFSVGFVVVLAAAGFQQTNSPSGYPASKLAARAVCALAVPPPAA